MIDIMIFGEGMQGPVKLSVDVEIQLDDAREKRIIVNAIQVAVRNAYLYLIGESPVSDDLNFRTLEQPLPDE